MSNLAEVPTPLATALIDLAGCVGRAWDTSVERQHNVGIAQTGIRERGYGSGDRLHGAATPARAAVKSTV